jgi:hypothetical protein
VHQALFVQDFLKLGFIAPQLLATRIALNSRDFLVRLAFSGISRVVPLALVEVIVVIALLVIVALGQEIVLLVLWSAHHAIMSRSSMAAVGRLRLKLWYVCFEKRLFWK